MDNSTNASHVVPTESNEPAVVTEHADQPCVRYVLPLLWSLHFALTEKQWKEVRERHKQRFPNWEKCTCPKQCKTNSLDEHWKYDNENHVKIFTGAVFICRGCHWLKSPGWRVLTWQQQLAGQLVPSVDPPHIISCLGWSQEKVEALKLYDLSRHHNNLGQIAALDSQVKQGTAAKLPAPVERMSEEELSKHVTPGQVMIVPWRVDLSALSEYGYSTDEISLFEERMYRAAAQRMDGKAGVGKVK